MTHLSLTEFIKANDILVDLIEATNAETFTKIPIPGKWSISEIGEHLLISAKSSYIAMLKAERPALPSEIYTSKAKITEMTKGYTVKWVAPESAVPTGKFLNPEDLVKELTKICHRIEGLTADTDLNLLASGFEHPRLGYLTVKQWLKFLTWHTKHHIVQIKDILGENFSSRDSLNFNV